jgi:hypothetical protein
MPQLNPTHLEELTRLTIANRRTLVRMRRALYFVGAPLALLAWAGIIAALKIFFEL